MAKTIAGVVEKPVNAQRLIDDLVQAKTDQIAQCARQVMTRHGALAPTEDTAP